MKLSNFRGGICNFGLLEGLQNYAYFFNMLLAS
jgi:hypothetical protein